MAQFLMASTMFDRWYGMLQILICSPLDFSLLVILLQVYVGFVSQNTCLGSRTCFLVKSNLAFLLSVTSGLHLVVYPVFPFMKASTDYVLWQSTVYCLRISLDTARWCKRVFLNRGNKSDHQLRLSSMVFWWCWPSLYIYSIPSLLRMHQIGH